MVDIAIMGHGVVGSGVAEVLLKNAKHIEEQAKTALNIKYILDLREFNNLSYSDKFTKDFSDIISDPDIKIVAEVMGGLNPAFSFVKQCLQAGKSVVTSNKELVAAKGQELLSIAKANNVNFLFEASVGGGIPILRPIAQCLAANNINSISGILNGTTNYILTKMISEGVSFNDALKNAQDLGYAEKNPDADILGYDACRKICILASLSFGKHIYPEQVETCGITEITGTDIALAENLGYVIKLIGRAVRLESGKISAFVGPMLISKSNMLANTSGVNNAIIVNGDAVGDVLFYGPGAGKLPTASAVVADIIDCAKHLEARKYLYWEQGDADCMENPENLNTCLFVELSNIIDNAAAKSFAESLGAENIVYNGNCAAFVTKSGVENQLKSLILSTENYTVEKIIRVLN